MQDHGNSQNGDNGPQQDQLPMSHHAQGNDAPEQRAEPRQPVSTLRDGPLKMSIWKNTGRNGEFYSTTISKTYTGRDGQPQDGHSFTRADLNKMGALAGRASEEMRVLQQGHSQQQEQRQEAQNRKAFVQKRQQSAPDPSKNRER